MARRPTDLGQVPSSYENFLYLLAEMERTVEGGTIEWPRDQANIILIRLGRMLRKVVDGLGIQPD